jgi:hypothetical protein
MDQNRKTLRHFQCRDYLWDIFTQMSQELECSVDYLVNESMRQYARSRNYGTKSGNVGAGTVPTATAPPHPTKPTGIPSLGSSGGAQRAPAPPPFQPPAAPPPPRASQQGLTPPPVPAPSTASFGLPGGSPAAPARESNPPPLPSGGNVAGTMPPGAPLSVLFNGQRYVVNKTEWVIGRGSKTADLAIRDGNISRRHAAVVVQGKDYVIKDLGSTNGIEFGGRRVDQKVIEEGDVFQVCDYELRFTFR